MILDDKSYAAHAVGWVAKDGAGSDLGAAAGSAGCTLLAMRFPVTG
jgi:hypothetical protein